MSGQRVIPLVALYDDPQELTRGLLLHLQQHFGTGAVLTGHWDRYRYDVPPGWVVAGGDFTNERAKRNALLELARNELHVKPTDWLLSIDPDERLVGAELLQAVLVELDGRLPFYPLLRQERNGEVWAVPCKLFTGRAACYTYLDTHVRFRELHESGPGHWSVQPSVELNLDPDLAIRGSRIMHGWPALLHLGSKRAGIAPTPGAFYSEPGQAPPAQHWQDAWLEAFPKTPIPGVTL